MKKIICFFKGHKRPDLFFDPITGFKAKPIYIRCQRCGDVGFSLFSNINRLSERRWVKTTKE